MASIRLASRLSLANSYGILRRCLFGTSSVRCMEKDGSSSEPSIDDSTPETSNDVSTSETSNDVSASGHVNDASTSEPSMDGSKETESMSDEDPTFSIDQMILDSATDGPEGSENFEEEYYYESEDELKSQILRTALEYVPEHGWSNEALKRAAEAEGLSSAVEDLFPRGPGDLVLHFIQDCNATLAEHLLHESEQRSKDTDRADAPKVSTTTIIQDAIITRLQMLRPYIHTWPQAVRLLMKPDTAPVAVENLAHMVDEIWYHAGDTSTDLNWYSKRGSLAAIYGASEMFMTQDKSQDFESTWKFVNQRLENAEQLKRASMTMQQVAKDASSFLSAAISTAQNMTGNNCPRR